MVLLFKENYKDMEIILNDLELYMNHTKIFYYLGQERLIRTILYENVELLRDEKMVMLIAKKIIQIIAKIP